MNIKYIVYILILELILAGCVKNTYDFNKFSKLEAYSPSLALSAASGTITLGDIVKASDTVVYDSNKLLKIVFKKDSVINFQLKDYYDLSNMVSFKKGYKIGDVALSDFKDSLRILLSSFSNSISPVPVNGTYIFPAFNSINLGNKSFSTFNNFQTAVFSSGTLILSVKNGLPFPLKSTSITLSGINPNGGPLIIPAMAAGETKSVTLNLTGKTVTNSITATIILGGSQGTFPTPVLVNLNSSMQVKIETSNLKVQSGRIIIPPQTLGPFSGTEIVNFDPGNGIEIESLKVLTGNIGYTFISTCDISGTFSLTLPKALRNGNPVVESAAIGSKASISRTIPLDNTIIELNSYTTQPFNRLPVNYSMTVSFDNRFINFNRNDSIYFTVNMLNPNLDYVKGYFGQITKSINPEIIETGLKDIMSSITGQLYIADPSITLNYSNSFGIPVDVALNATGKRDNLSVSITPAFALSYPTSLTTRDVSSSFTINNANTNSDLSKLVSLPPYQISFSGSAKMNSSGSAGVRNNYVFGNSRFLGSLEVNIPMQFWLNNIQFSDTLENFLKSKDGTNSSFSPGNMDSLKVNLVALNGFPMGASVKMILYDTIKKEVVRSVNASNIILAAPVDGTGKVTGKTESNTSIYFDKTFFESINSANRIILLFTLKTSGNGTTDVKLYSDYKITFKATVFARPRIKI